MAMGVTKLHDAFVLLFAHLAGLAALQTLNLSRCYSITDGGVAHLEGLAALDLSDYGAITNRGVAGPAIIP